MGASELRDLYLKTENAIDGEYFATIIKVSCGGVRGTQLSKKEPSLPTAYQVTAR